MHTSQFSVRLRPQPCAFQHSSDDFSTRNPDVTQVLTMILLTYMSARDATACPAFHTPTNAYQHTEIDNLCRTQTLIHVPSSMHASSILHSHRHTHTLPKSSHKSEGVWSTTPGRGSRRGWVIYWLLIFQVVLTWRWSLPSLNDNICLPAGKMGNINKRYIFETKPP